MTDTELFIPEGYIAKASLYKDQSQEIIKAENMLTGKPVVLKVSRPGNTDIIKIAKLSHEYNTLKNLQHDGIIKVQSIVSKNKAVCVVEEFFAGENLKSRIFRQPLSLNEFFNIADQLTDILIYLHGHNIIHKDINSTNIMINADNKVKLIDFGISTNYMNEEQEMIFPESIEGTLPYIAPEQTGRTSYSITPGSDLYSLGIVLYELLTGKPPFDSADALEVIHFHLSRTPALLTKVVPSVPAGLEIIIANLLEKIPDDRYQSAAGLKYDLRQVKSLIDNNKPTNYFNAKSQDKSSKFRKTQRLYGREVEINKLIQDYDQLSESKSMLTLVAGYSGVGKSAVVKQLQRPVTEKNGLFISGKFDQFKRNIPYFAFIEAFDTALKNILSESNDKITEWKNKFDRVLGANAVLITEGLPSLELIIGKLPPIEKLPPAEQEYRYRLVLLDFIYCFTSKEHPLVIFLDDLQWSDLPSLNLLERILTYRRESDILIVGAYRSNEVNEAHPLSITLNQIKKEGSIKIDEINLLPLDEVTTIQIVADSFGMPLTQANELGKHVFNKTQGNPFFINRFLQSLYENKLVRLDVDRNWIWDQHAIEGLSYTDNVIDLMARELYHLPENARGVLKNAAVLGNTFNLSTISLVMHKSMHDVFRSLEPALNTGYLIAVDPKYRAFSLFNEGINESFANESQKLAVNIKFLHDRVQQAAYALIEEGEKAQIHLDTARTLVEKLPEDKINDQLFDIVNHYSQGQHLLTDLHEKRQVAELYYRAGKKAKESTSYDVAVRYLDAARTLLPDDAWSAAYPLTFNVYSELSESASLEGKHAEAEKLFDELLSNAKTNLEKLKIYYVHSSLYLKIGNTVRSLQLGREAMKLYNISFPESDRAIRNKASLEVAKYLILFSTKYRNKEKLYHLKECTDPEIIMINQFLIDIATSAYQVNQNLMVIVVLKIIDHYIKHGFTDASGWGFSGFSTIAYSGIGLSRQGLNAWDITRKLHQRTKSSIIKTKLDYTVNAFFTQWKYPLLQNLHDITNNVKACLMNGDPNFSGYAMALYFWKQVAGGVKLNDAIDSVKEYLEYMINNKIDAGYNFITPSLQFAKVMNGQVLPIGEWNSQHFNEEKFRTTLQEIGNKTNIAFYYNFKLPYYYFFGKFKEGLAWAEEGDGQQLFILGHYFVSDWYFYYSLLIYSNFASLSSQEKFKFQKILKRNIKWFKHWIKGCAENFEQQLLILHAEDAVLNGFNDQALKLYTQAAESASKHGFIQFAAIANERASALLAKSNIKKQSDYYLKDAYNLYEQWSAYGKCKILSLERPDLFSDKVISLAGNTKTNLSTAALDYGSLIKASHSIASKIKLDELLQSLMNVLLENAGAQRGALIIPKENELYVIAEGRSGPGNILSNISIPVSTSHDLPRTLFNYCWRTVEAKTFANASRDENFGSDPYFKEKKIKSAVCLPLANKGNKVGLIYLENPLLEGVFTPNKLEVLNMLAGQIGISIDNSLLYENLENKVEERTHDLEKQKQIAEAQSRVAIEQKLVADDERKKSDTLLLNILPLEIANELKAKGESQARHYDHVTVMFTDFVNFTSICEILTPTQLVAELNKCFGAFDKIIDKYHMEKIKTIGDAYLAVSGLPKIRDDHAVLTCQAAKDILEWVKNPANNCQFDIRIGIHSGSVIAGIVGTKKYVYDIWGDTVNTASRMESSSFPGKINISESTYQLIKGQMTCDYRGEIDAKNKGRITMYFLN